MHLRELKDEGYFNALPWIDRVVDYKGGGFGFDNVSDDKEEKEVKEEKEENKKEKVDKEQEEGEMQILVKFYGKSHFHNKWIRLSEGLDSLRWQPIYYFYYSPICYFYYSPICYFYYSPIYYSKFAPTTRRTLVNSHYSAPEKISK